MLPAFVERQQVMTMATVPLCGSFVNDEYNTYRYCPADGTYNFNTEFEMESPNNFVSWTRTGYRGQMIVNIYLDSSMKLVGRCTMGIRTKPSIPILSGMFVSTMLILSVCGYIGYVISRRRARSQSNLQLPEHTDSDTKTDELLPYEDKFRFKVIPYKRQPKPEPEPEDIHW